MSDTPDELEKLLIEVRKTIRDNQQFLQTLVADSDVDEPQGEEAADQDVDQGQSDNEDFEEL